MATSPTTLVPTRHGQFANAVAVEFKEMPAAHVVSARFVDADGRELHIDLDWRSR